MMQTAALDTPGRLRGVLLTLWLVTFVSASQFLLVAPILPRIGEVFSVPEALLGTLTTSYAVALGVFALVAGPISDRVGRRWILLAGTAVQTVALAAHGLAWDFGSLLALRSLSGMAAGILAGASVAYVGDALPYHRRGHAIGWIMSGMAFGQILGVPIGTLVASELGFRAPFVALAGLMGVAFALTWALLPAVPVPGGGRRLTLSNAVGGYVELLRRPDVAAVNVASVIMMLGVSLYIVYMPSWMETELGASSLGVATLFLAGGTAGALVGPYAGSLSDRIGRKGLIVVASTVQAGLTAITAWLTTVWAVDVLFFAIMVSASMRMSPLQALMTGLVGEERRGSLLSLNMAVGQLGFALGGGLSGTIYARYGFHGNAWLGGIAALLVAGIIGLFTVEPRALTARPTG